MSHGFVRERHDTITHQIVGQCEALGVAEHVLRGKVLAGAREVGELSEGRVEQPPIEFILQFWIVGEPVRPK